LDSFARQFYWADFKYNGNGQTRKRRWGVGGDTPKEGRKLATGTQCGRIKGNRVNFVTAYVDLGDARTQLKLEEKKKPTADGYLSGEKEVNLMKMGAR